MCAPAYSAKRLCRYSPLQSVIRQNPLVICQKNCPTGDGFGAAFAAWLALSDSAEYYPADYGGPVPSVSGRTVYILDLSFPA